MRGRNMVGMSGGDAPFIGDIKTKVLLDVQSKHGFRETDGQCCLGACVVFFCGSSSSARLGGDVSFP